jgi:hypothetical protein
VGIVTVVLCAATIFGIGILTTSGTILKAAKTNPVDTFAANSDPQKFGQLLKVVIGVIDMRAVILCQ